MMILLALSTILVTFISKPEFEVESCIAEPFALVEYTLPRYPIHVRTGGYVDLQATVGKDGSVSESTIIRAEPKRLFDKEARRTLKKWKFNTSEHEERCINVTLKWTLEDNE